MLHVLHTSGFKQSVCDQGFYSGPVSKFWAYAFVVSKAPELGRPSDGRGREDAWHWQRAAEGKT